MDFDLSDELLAVRELGREFAEKEIAPTAAADDRDHHFRREIFEKMGQLGFFGCVVSEDYGGTGLGYMAMVLLTEEIARVHSSVRVHVNTQLAPAVALARFGTEEQKRRWIPGLVDASRIGCFAITEPDSGSDVASMSTRAARTDDGYVLNGTKTWISNAPIADLALVYAVTDREAGHRGLSAFMVELDQRRRSPGHPGQDGRAGVAHRDAGFRRRDGAGGPPHRSRGAGLCHVHVAAQPDAFELRGRGPGGGPGIAGGGRGLCQPA